MEISWMFIWSMHNSPIWSMHNSHNISMKLCQYVCYFVESQSPRAMLQLIEIKDFPYCHSSTIGYYPQEIGFSRCAVTYWKNSEKFNQDKRKAYSLHQTTISNSLKAYKEHRKGYHSSKMKHMYNALISGFR